MSPPISPLWMMLDPSYGWQRPLMDARAI